MIFKRFCGEEIWDNNTVYSDNPDFSYCFQNTILIWIPCFVLWSIAPLWWYMLTRTKRPKTKPSIITILKIVNILFVFLNEFVSILKFI